MREIRPRPPRPSPAARSRLDLTSTEAARFESQWRPLLHGVELTDAVDLLGFRSAASSKLDSELEAAGCDPLPRAEADLDGAEVGTSALPHPPR
jgi:hypothetical protein